MQTSQRSSVTLDEWNRDAALRRRAWTGLTVAAASIFLFVLDSGLIGLALPVIREDYPTVPLATTAWAATGFLVAVASLLLIGGRFADRYGRKRMYLLGVLVFSVASSLTAIAPNIGFLIAARVVQGAAGALLTSSALALVMPLFPKEKHGSMVGTWGAVGSIASILAPTVGALLIEVVSWRLPFALVTPLGLAVWVAGRRVLDEQIDGAAHSTVDRVGMIIGPLALGLLALSLSRGGLWGWSSGLLIGLLTVALGLLTAFVLRCRRVASPLLDLSVFRYPVYRANAMAGGFQQIGFFTWWVTAPLVVTQLWGWSIRQAGLGIALGQVAATISATLGGRWADRVGSTIPTIASGLVVIVGSLWMITRATIESDFWGTFLPATIVMGIGGGVCGSLTTGAALREVPSAALGAANSVLQLVRRVTGTLGVATATAIVGDTSGPVLLGRAKRVWLMMMLAHVAMIAALVAVHGRSRRRDQAVSR